MRTPTRAAFRLALTGGLGLTGLLFLAAQGRAAEAPEKSLPDSTVLFVRVNDAEGLRQSVTLGVGQFCTKPGVVVAIDDDSTRRFVATAAELMQAAPQGTMLHSGIYASFAEGALEGVDRKVHQWISGSGIGAVPSRKSKSQPLSACRTCRAQSAPHPRG